MCALRSLFFKSKSHVLDFVVVCSSFWLEAPPFPFSFPPMLSQASPIVWKVEFMDNPQGGLLVIARMWRFVRIAHGLFEVTVDDEAFVLKPT